MALKIIHHEIIKTIGLRIEKLADIYDRLVSSKKFSKLGLNYINFGEAMAKLERLYYIKRPETHPGQLYELTSDGVKIYLKLLERRK